MKTYIRTTTNGKIIVGLVKDFKTVARFEDYYISDYLSEKIKRGEFEIIGQPKGNKYTRVKFTN